MRVIFNIVRVSPNGIEEVVAEDLASYTVDDSKIVLKFNKSADEVIELRANDGEHIHEWSGVSSFVTRVGLQLEQ